MANIKSNHQRRLKPKVSKQTPLPILIQKLSFLSIEGTTQILIHPSKTLVDSKQLLNMINEKKDTISLENGLCVFRNDIFQATEAALEKVEDGPLKIKDLSPPTSMVVPKRPTNAFILYRNALRKRVKRVFPEFNNSQVSKFLGAMWNNASSEVKEKYEALAMERRRAHKEVYPDFEYNPKQKTLASSESLLRDLNEFDANCLLNYSLLLNELSQNDATTDLDSIPDLNKMMEDADLLNSSVYGVNVPLPKPSLICNEYCCSDEGNREFGEWNQVCNMITDLFPETPSQSQLINEILWSNFENTEQYHHTDRLTDPPNGNHVGTLDSLNSDVANSTDQEKNGLGY